MAKYIDYAFKSYVIKEHSDLISKLKQASLKDYAIDRFIVEGVYSPILDKDVYSVEALYNKCAVKGQFREFFEAVKIIQASYKRTKRLKQRIGSMLRNGSCIFLTLTFNDETLTKTTPKQRRVMVSRFLGGLNCKYVANIDFGSKNHREHYHAVVNTDYVNYKSWLYGSVNGERIRTTTNDTNIKLSKYICKLSNHAIKETTQRSSLMYSRH